MHVGTRGSHEPKRPTSHDALSSMAAARLSHSAAGDGVDTRSLFERSKEQAAETAYDMRKSILPVLPESDHEDLDDVATEGSSRGGTEKSDSEVPPATRAPANTHALVGKSLSWRNDAPVSRASSRHCPGPCRSLFLTALPCTFPFPAPSLELGLMYAPLHVRLRLIQATEREDSPPPVPARKKPTASDAGQGEGGKGSGGAFASKLTHLRSLVKEEVPSSRASTASTAPAQPAAPPERDSTRARAPSSDKARKPSDAKGAAAADKAAFRDKLAILKSLSSGASSVASVSAPTKDRDDVVLEPRPGEAVLEAGDDREEGKEAKDAGEGEDDFFASVVPSHVPGGAIGGYVGEKGREAGGEPPGRAPREGVVTESIWSNMWAGGARASVETARASYSQGKISAKDLAKFQSAVNSELAPAPARPVSTVPGEKRALEFKLAKLTKKLEKASARGETAKVGMYEKEAERLRQQLADLDPKTTAARALVAGPAAGTTAGARGESGGFGSKLAAFKDMVSGRRDSKTRPQTDAQSESGSAQTERGGCPEPEKCGVGLKVAIKEHRHVVMAMLPGSASDQSALRQGDCIVKVDGVAVAGKTLPELSAMLSGPYGSTVVLDTSRGGVAQTPIALQRRPVAALLSTMAPDLHPTTWHRERVAGDDADPAMTRPDALALPPLPEQTQMGVDKADAVELGYPHESWDDAQGEWGRMSHGEGKAEKWSALDAEAPLWAQVGLQ